MLGDLQPAKSMGSSNLEFSRGEGLGLMGAICSAATCLLTDIWATFDVLEIGGPDNQILTVKMPARGYTSQRAIPAFNAHAKQGRKEKIQSKNAKFTWVAIPRKYLQPRPASSKSWQGHRQEELPAEPDSR